MAGSLDDEDGRSGASGGAGQWELVPSRNAAPPPDSSKAAASRPTQRRPLPPRLGHGPRLVSPAASKNPAFGRTLVGMPAADVPLRGPGPARLRDERPLIDLLSKALPESVTPAPGPSQGANDVVAPPPSTGEHAPASASDVELAAEAPIPWYQRSRESSRQVEAQSPPPRSYVKMVGGLLTGLAAAIAIFAGVFGLAGPDGEEATSSREESASTPLVRAERVAPAQRVPPAPPPLAANASPVVARAPVPAEPPKPVAVSSKSESTRAPHTAYPIERRGSGSSSREARARARAQLAPAPQNNPRAEAARDDRSPPPALQRASFHEPAAVPHGPAAATATGGPKVVGPKRAAGAQDVDAPMPLGNL